MIKEIFSGIAEGVLSPLFSWLNKKEDVSLEKFKVNGQVDINAVQNYVEALKLRRDVLIEAMKYRGIRFFQYGFMFPLVIWFLAMVGYCVLSPYFSEIKAPKALPGIGDQILLAVISFLFLGQKIDEWRRK